MDITSLQGQSVATIWCEGGFSADHMHGFSRHDLPSETPGRTFPNTDFGAVVERKNHFGAAELARRLAQGLSDQAPILEFGGLYRRL